MPAELVARFKAATGQQSSGTFLSPGQGASRTCRIECVALSGRLCAAWGYSLVGCMPLLDGSGK